MNERVPPSSPGDSPPSGSPSSWSKVAARGLSWEALSQGIRLALQLGLLVFMTRILSPAVYGHYAVALAAWTLMEGLADLGMGTTVAQRQDVNPQMARSCWRAALLSGLLWGAVLGGSAPWVGSLTRIPEVVPLVQVMALALALRGLANVPLALLVRDFRFKAVALTETAAAVARTALVVGLGREGWGASSFAVGLVGEWGVTALLATAAVRGRTAGGGPFLPAMTLLRAGVHQCSGAFIAGLALRLERLLIARWLGAGAAGTWGFAQSLAFMPIDRLGPSLGRVAFPIYAKLQGNPQDMARAWLGATRAVASLLVPLSLIIVVLAGPLLKIATSPQWWSSAQTVSLLGLAALLLSLNGTPFTLWRATGRERLYRDFQVGSLLILVTGLAMVRPLGLPGIIGFALLRALATVALGQWISSRLLHLSFGDWWRAVSPSLLAGGGAALGAELVRRGMGSVGESPWLPLLGGGATLLILYSLLLGILDPQGRKMLRGWVGF